MFSDYHVHSELSFDSKEPAENQVKKAICLGMKQICFTEHIDIGWNYYHEHSYVDIDLYNHTIASLKQKYNGQIDILKGIEIGLTKENINESNKVVAQNDFDYVLASIHELYNADPYYPEFWKNKDEKIVIRDYFLTMYELIKKFDNFDTLAHMDYIVRYTPTKDYQPSDFKAEIDNILKYLIDNNKNLEINTSNLAKGGKYPNPYPFILERYSALGGKNVVVGSDAHKSEFLGHGFDEAQKLIEKYHLINIKG